jgi:hypothetical protein
MIQKTSLIQAKVLVAECLDAQRDLAKFLAMCADRYKPVLTLDETLEGRKLLDRVSNLLSRIQASDDSYHRDSSDEDLTEPLNVMHL